MVVTGPGLLLAGTGRLTFPVSPKADMPRPLDTARHFSRRTLLRVGMTNADAVRVQRAMNAALASGLAVSGTYRPATATAVKAYQRAVGLPVTGTVTAATWAALERGRT